MFEMTLSLFAWLGVLLIQAMVHYYLTSKRRAPRLEEEPPPLEASPLVLESLGQLHADARKNEVTSDRDITTECNLKEDNLSTAKTESIQSMDSFEDGDWSHRDHVVDDYLSDSDDLSFDGDEPQMFFLLLSQTGSEMMRVSECYHSYQ